MNCSSCNREDRLITVRLPQLPMAIEMCPLCVNAGAIPYDILVSLVWLGKIDVTDAWARDIAVYHGISGSEFEADCVSYADKMFEVVNGEDEAT